jgi:2-keto-4-pentenoate hydratase/2-oxohepta-3-ene-1,7-dioic acid hydratase in catechol pathway
MVKSIYFLKPAWCGIHLAGLWPEQGLQPVTRATALQAVVFTLNHGDIIHITIDGIGTVENTVA